MFIWKTQAAGVDGASVVKQVHEFFWQLAAVFPWQSRQWF